MPTAILARTKPYPDELLRTERICKRCGIQYYVRSDRKNWPECKDCREVETVKCGTPAGSRAHYRLGEPACHICKAARNERRPNRKEAA